MLRYFLVACEIFYGTFLNVSALVSSRGYSTFCIKLQGQLGQVTNHILLPRGVELSHPAPF